MGDDKMAEAEAASAELEIEKFQFEQNKWAQELQVRYATLAVEKQKAIYATVSGAAAAAVITAIIGLSGTIAVKIIEEKKIALATHQAQLDRETKLILEAVKTGNPDQAAFNLKFFIDFGLIRDPVLTKELQEYLKNRPPSSGPTLPGLKP
jgi:flagellar biosynthesis/type III secretory pathway M-ring protein FliF/YscJ